MNMEKIFKIENEYEVLIIIALNKDWAEEYYYRKYNYPILKITEIKDTRIITLDDFQRLS